MRAATVVQVLQDLFYVLLHVLFYLWSLLNSSCWLTLRAYPIAGYLHTCGSFSCTCIAMLVCLEIGRTWLASFRYSATNCMNTYHLLCCLVRLFIRSLQFTHVLISRPVAYKSAFSSARRDDTILLTFESGIATASSVILSLLHVAVLCQEVLWSCKFVSSLVGWLVRWYCCCVLIAVNTAVWRRSVHCEHFLVNLI